MIEDLYQPQTSISNTYVLTFSDEVVKAIKKYVEQQSTPIFKEIIEMCRQMNYQQKKVMI